MGPMGSNDQLSTQLLVRYNDREGINDESKMIFSEETAGMPVPVGASWLSVLMHTVVVETAEIFVSVHLLPHQTVALLKINTSSHSVVMTERGRQ